jgi:hypothetical protein
MTNNTFIEQLIQKLIYTGKNRHSQKGWRIKPTYRHTFDPVPYDNTICRYTGSKVNRRDQRDQRQCPLRLREQPILDSNGGKIL